jgi:hypothetical protein
MTNEELKEFYEKLVEDFLKESYMGSPAPHDLPEPSKRDFFNLYGEIENWREPGDEAWNEFRTQMLEESKERLATEFDVFTEHLYHKHFATPGTVCGELALFIAQAKEVLPHKFRVDFKNMWIWTSEDYPDALTVSFDVVFFNEKFLKGD